MSPLIVGHRGVSGTFPENTTSSIKQAISLGLRWVEVDIQPAKDGTLVVCHDHTVDRCSNGLGRVDSFTLSQLKQLDFGSWFSDEFIGESILTLDELLQLSIEHDLNVNIEIKVDQHDANQVVKQLNQQLAQSDIPSDCVILSSFSQDIMRVLHQHCPGYRLSVISETVTDSVHQLLEEINAFGCHLNYQHINKEQLKSLKNKGYQVWCYTVNRVDTFPLLNHVDAIFTDYPERFL
ncbi:glycerophosphoryl diester phosphodiesterase [Aliivibrio kagoshimensis]|uniref:glycerophosphoryl diester phosphodiesterase n=1 Tax=Aliivibrio kagoshimensis TaxID=2910230 RepID=UPI003D0E576C